LPKAHLARAYCSAIHSLVGTAQPRTRRSALSHGVGAFPRQFSTTTLFLQRTTNGAGTFFRSTGSSSRSAITFACRVGIAPVGVRPLPKRAAVSGIMHRQGKRNAKSQHQWTEYVRRSRERYTAALRHPPAIADDRYKIPLRRRPLRRLHGSHQWRGGAGPPDLGQDTPPPA